MEKTDQALLQSLLPSNRQLKSLYDEHVRLEREVQKFERFAHFSATAAIQQKVLKKEKLKGMDNIMAILDEHRH